MPEITFLPWLGLEHSVTVRGVRICPLARFLNSAECPDEERHWLETYFNCYRDRAGSRPVDSVCIVDHAHADAAFNPSLDTIMDSIAVASLIWNHSSPLAFGQGQFGLLPSRGERWLRYTQRFDPSVASVAIEEGYMLSHMRLEDFVELRPLQAGGEVRRLRSEEVSIAESLAGAAAQDADAREALTLLIEGAMTTTRQVLRVNVLHIGSALELLSGARGQSQKGAVIGRSLKRAVEKARDGWPGETDALMRATGAARLAGPDSVRDWMAGCQACRNQSCTRHAPELVGFYQRRNQVAHEGTTGTDLRVQRADTGQPHWFNLADAAMLLAGWLLLERAGAQLTREHWASWCTLLDKATRELGM